MKINMLEDQQLNEKLKVLHKYILQDRGLVFHTAVMWVKLPVLEKDMMRYETNLFLCVITVPSARLSSPGVTVLR